jgi:hypothetical protein
LRGCAGGRHCRRQDGRAPAHGEAADPADRRNNPAAGALVRAGLETLSAIIRAQGERASRRFIEFFTASIRNRNTGMSYARAVKQFFD